MSGICIEVPPRSRKKLRELADNLRHTFRVHTPYFPIVEVLELGLPQVWDEYEFVILDRAEMGEEHGRTYPDLMRIEIRSDVYAGACQDEGRDRFTLAHELGHLLLHPKVHFARYIPTTDIPAYRNSEWQANTFASELLMPVDAVTDSGGPLFYADTCKVSGRAAEVRWEQLQQEGIIRCRTRNP